jgi:hypothetical protein
MLHMKLCASGNGRGMGIFTILNGKRQAGSPTSFPQRVMRASIGFRDLSLGAFKFHG